MAFNLSIIMNYSSVLPKCPDNNMVEFVYNMTALYGENGDQAPVVAISALTFFLAAVLFDLNLFSRISRVSAVLNPTIHFLLAASLNLFVPVMSYFFSEAKNGGVHRSSKPAAGDNSGELTLLARVILIWMLLAELLRKKVDCAVTSSGTQGYSTIVTHASHVLWMGNLVFFNVKASGKKAIFGVLWVLCAAKLVQRVVITEMAKRSFAHGKNPRLISSYIMTVPPCPSLKECRYAVMGEENMVIRPGPRGYELDLAVAKTDDVLTVGKIWGTRHHPNLKRLCLSFALFKLLRRRLENVPAMTDQETTECRSIIFDALCGNKDSNKDSNKDNNNGVGDDLPAEVTLVQVIKDNNNGVGDDLPAEVTLFQVIKDEVTFLTEYYHSVLPVVFASPYFFFVNYVLFPVVVAALCVMTIVLCGNGGIIYAFKSVWTDSSVLSLGVVVTTIKCLLRNVTTSSKAFYTLIDLTICYILFFAVAYEEASEIFVFLVSNWFTVSLLHAYFPKPTFPAAVHFILSRSRKLRHYPSNINIKQLSLLGICTGGLSALALPTAKLPKRTKRSIFERFRRAAGGAAPLSNGRAALPARFAWACESSGVAEVILVWHIATSILETTPHHTEQTTAAAKAKDERWDRKTAATLSRYCAYLVAFKPELLPDHTEGTERVYGDMKEQIKAAVGGPWWSYYLLSEWSRRDKVHKIADDFKPDFAYASLSRLTMVQKGAVLGKMLLDEADKGDGAAVWKMVADVWVDLAVYVAPSSVEEHVRGHEAALVQGIELVTLLWVLATHTGITRPDDDDDHHHHDEENAAASVQQQQ
uniref:DUF4220 domain-containing protein n=1 Tax=Oryza punctata TaxID=4537 RepID=A0A0E0L750_ORYPU